ncbi:MAG: PAS domain-containing sensor histidine kinase, partial [Deltaproteobacteria bacterium]
PQAARPPIDLNDPIYNRLTATAPHLLCVADRSGSVTSVSPAFIAYVGVPDASDLLGQKWLHAVHPDDCAACRCAWQKSFDAAAAFSFEVRVRSGADGTYRWWLLHGAPEANGDGEPSQWVCVFTSIEAQKNAARKARNDEDRLQTILQRTPMLAFRTDMQGRITMADGKGLQTLQRTKEALHGTLLSQYTAAVPEMDAAVRRCLANEKVDLEVSLRGVDWQIYLAPEVNAEGQQTGLIGLAIDITQRNRAARLAVSERAARESGQVKAQFLANMSHEVRTPLAGVLGVAELLHDLPLTPEQVRYVEMIQASGQGLLHVINDILSLSQSQTARGPRPLTSFSPAVMLRNQVEMMRSLAQRRGLHLHLLCAEDVPARVLGDVGRIAQVLLNLLSNAIKFTHVGSVELGCHMTDVGALRFYVRDSGIGLDAQARSRLFLPYTQADHKVAGRYGGTGLGLSICRDLVKQMGGDIGVESTLGESTTFWFTVHL